MLVKGATVSQLQMPGRTWLHKTCILDLLIAARLKAVTGQSLSLHEKNVFKILSYRSLCLALRSLSGRNYLSGRNNHQCLYKYCNVMLRVVHVIWLDRWQITTFALCLNTSELYSCGSWCLLIAMLCIWKWEYKRKTLSGATSPYIYHYYREVSNIRRTLVGNWIVDHSDVVGASPVGAAPTTSSFST